MSCNYGNKLNLGGPQSHLLTYRLPSAMVTMAKRTVVLKSLFVRMSSLKVSPSVCWDRGLASLGDVSSTQKPVLGREN